MQYEVQDDDIIGSIINSSIPEDEETIPANN